MNQGRDWEWVVIDLEYYDETFGYSQPMYRYEAKLCIDRGLARGRPIDGTGKVARKAQIVYLDPQPTVVLLDEGVPS